MCSLFLIIIKGLDPGQCVPLQWKDHEGVENGLYYFAFVYGSSDLGINYDLKILNLKAPREATLETSWHFPSHLLIREFTRLLS